MLVLRDVESQQSNKYATGYRDVCFASVFVPDYLSFITVSRCEIIFHSLPETAKQHFPMNSDPIHPQYMYARCSLLRKPLFRVFTYVLSEKPIYSQNRVPTSVLIPEESGRVIKFSYGFAFSRANSQ